MMNNEGVSLDRRKVVIAARGVLNQLSLGGILLVKRDDTMSNPGTWELPGGTGLPTDMFPETILTREFGEETNINVYPNSLLGVWSQCDTRALDFDGIFMTYIYVVSFEQPGYEGSSPERRVVLSNEHSEYAWVPPNQSSLANYRLHPDTSSALDRYMERMRQVRLNISKGAAIQRADVLANIEKWIHLNGNDVDANALDALRACVRIPSGF